MKSRNKLWGQEWGQNLQSKYVLKSGDKTGSKIHNFAPKAILNRLKKIEKDLYKSALPVPIVIVCQPSVSSVEPINDD